MSTLILIRHGESQWNLENRFTGWVDVPLSEKGKQEAKDAAQKLRSYRFDCAFTSKLSRAQETLRVILEASAQTGIPTQFDQALNERHYGALQGLNKSEMVQKFGAEQVHLWRRSYDTPPPKDITELNPLGMSESLKDTAARTIPYWEQQIFPALLQGKNVIVAAHGNSLRSIVMHLDHLTKEQVVELNIPTGAPLLYLFDEKGQVKEKRYL